MSTDVTAPLRLTHFASVTDEPSTGFRRPMVSMPRISQQYALPIHNPNSYKDSNNASSQRGDCTPRAEDTLRRKTPNGTLSAGFDVSSDDLTPPLKHQVVPSREANSNSRPSSAYIANGKRTFLQHQHQKQQNITYPSWSRDSAGGWQPSQYAQPQAAFPVDSVLQQMPTQPFHIQQYYGQTVPSAMQPSYPYVGPTASGGQGHGLYGPYWHDGTYVPYRPAAIRDPRFYHHGPSYANNLTGSQSIFQDALWQQSNPSSTAWVTGYGAGSFTPAPLTVSAQGHQVQRGIPYGHAARPVSGEGSYFTTPGSLLPPSPYAVDTQQTRESVQSEYGSASPNGRQRDKTFTWALQQYRELLAFIHHTRRQQQQSRQANGQQNIPQRPSFYPKPPRPSPSGSSQQIAQTKADTDGTCKSSEADPPVGSPRADSGTEDHRMSNQMSNTLPASVRPSSGVPFYDNSDYHRRASIDQLQRPPLFSSDSMQQAERQRTLRRSTGSSVSTMFLPQDESPPVKATAALSQMTRLCQDAQWQWIDGMHLGGCLAYGLGNYQKALKWYNKVLERDPKHLEATSNLAATLLALGDRPAAEQYWIKAVRAAPNHFEAVEHLVGLLCNEQRSRDAIKVIEYVERSLRQSKSSATLKTSDRQSECSSSTASRSPCISERSDKMIYEFDADVDPLAVDWREAPGASEPGFGSSGFAIPGCDNGRILALIHAKGNMLYGLGDNSGAARAFEDAVLIATGSKYDNVQGLIKHILSVVSVTVSSLQSQQGSPSPPSGDPILLSPDQALATAKLCFPYVGELPGLRHVSGGSQSLARKAVVSTTSNSLLSLAKIFQDGMSNASANRPSSVVPLTHGVRDILALYYLSLSLQPSPSTANNVGILLASVQQVAAPTHSRQKVDFPGIAPGSGIALALQYYNYGLQLDQNHAHLYTNLGSLLKDIGQLDAAISMYERAVKCDGKFDIALANLANAVKDKGRISDAIIYYKRAVEVSPDFAEAVCGLANALNSVCGWQARGGIAEDGGRRDRWHVDSNGMLLDARQPGATSSGWVRRVVDIVEKQLIEGETWGAGTLTPSVLEGVLQQVINLDGSREDAKERELSFRKTLAAWTGHRWEGARITRLIERATKRIGWHWYRDTYVTKVKRSPSAYNRPQLPAALAVPSAPTVLPFHTFTCPMSAKQIRLISQRNALRISTTTLRSPWLPKQVFPPPNPPAPYLRVGYVSSDFNNHPLAHLMQSVFGLHQTQRVKAYCYATTASDNSVHRQQIQSEAPVFHDASSWSAERLVTQIVRDGIHILVNLNGYTRGARNEVFAARPAPIQMSFMGFAGTLGAEWCDYLLADEIAVPVDTLRPWRRNVDLEDQIVDQNNGGDDDNWVYGENIIYCRDTFFCCDHKQSAPDAKDKQISWDEEQKRRWQMRKELFPQLSDDTIIFGNFNQLYKVGLATDRIRLTETDFIPRRSIRLLFELGFAYSQMYRIPFSGSCDFQILASPIFWQQLACGLVERSHLGSSSRTWRPSICTFRVRVFAISSWIPPNAMLTQQQLMFFGVVPHF